jgi:hypothetical protein
LTRHPTRGEPGKPRGRDVTRRSNYGRIPIRSSSGLAAPRRRAPARGPPRPARGPSTPQPRDEERGTMVTFDQAKSGTAAVSLISNIGVHSNSPWNRHGSVVGARASGPVFMLRLMRLHLAGTWAGNRGRQVRATTGEGCSQSHRIKQDVDNPITIHVIVLRCVTLSVQCRDDIYWLDDSSQEQPTAITALTSTVSCPWFLGWQARVFRLAVHSPFQA